MSLVVTVGDTITFQTQKKKKKHASHMYGKVRYIGQIEGKIGIYYGIELDETTTISSNNYNMSIDTQYYFHTNNKSIFIKKKQILKILIKNGNALRMNVGDIVRVPKFDCNAIIRFIGEFRPPSLWCGVQLEDKKGDNNGSIYGHKYFSCLQDYGSFLSQNDIKLIQQKKQRI
eukprot:UN08292